MEKTMTEREFLEGVSAIDTIKENSKYMEYIAKRLETLDKKNATRRDKNQEVNQVICNMILNTLTLNDNAMSTADLLNNNEDLKNYRFEDNTCITSQRLTYLLKILCDNNQVTKTKEKGIVKYSLI